MAGFYQQSLRSASTADMKTTLRDYKHAEPIFRTNAYANTPKFKWLFHVYFDINETLVTNNGIASVFPTDANHGILVKSIELPKFTIPLTELNQYNRKRYIQTKIQYDPVRVAFHDDNNDLIRHLWYTYYSYYYNDPSQPYGRQGSDSGSQSSATELNKTNIYSPDISSAQNWGYLGEINSTATSQSLFISKAPFFRSISIFGFNQHNFSQYQLINPIIENFNHDTYNYYETSGIMENSMTLKYESVKYYSGALDGEKPGEIVKKFAIRGMYDTDLSPIAVPGTNSMILGQGRLVNSANGVVSNWADPKLGALQTPGQLATTFNTNPSLSAAVSLQLIAGAPSARNNPDTARGLNNFPSIGSNTGAGAQIANSAGQINTNPQAIPDAANNPISATA